MGILDRAELLLQAKNYSGSGGWLDESGNGHDAQFGSTAGADTNDPEVLAHDGEDYVRLPGVAGNFVDTADVNLLDADTAHLAQSVGLWSTAQLGAYVPNGGDYGLIDLEIVAASGAERWNLAATSISLTAVEHTYSVTVNNLEAGSRTLALRLTVNGANHIENVVCPAGVSRQSMTFTPTAGAVTEGRLTPVTDMVAGDQWEFSLFVLRTGTDATFVPSSRIVGDYEMNVKAAVSSAITAVTQAEMCGVLADQNSYMTRIAVNAATPTIAVVYYWTDTAFRSFNVANGIVVDTPTNYKMTRVKSTGVTSWLVDDAVIGTETQDAGVGLDVSKAANGVKVGGWAARGLLGDVYWFEVRDGIDGPVVARYSAEDAVEPFATQTGSVDGRVWTYNRSGSGLYVVDRPAFGLHTDDYFEVADHADLDFAAGESLTVLVAYRDAAAPSATDYLLSKKVDSSTGAGYQLSHDAAPMVYGTVADGTAKVVDAKAGASVRTLSVATLVRDVVSDDVEIFVDAVSSGSPTTDSTTATLANASVLRLGSRADAVSQLFDGEIVAVALFREALTDDEIVAAGEALLYGETATWVLLDRRPAVHVGARR